MSMAGGSFTGFYVAPLPRVAGDAVL
jgi:hypothetical protein